MKKFFAALVLVWILAVHSAAAALAQVHQIGYVQYIAIPAVDTAVPLHGQFRSIQIMLDASSSDVFVEIHNQTATLSGATTIHIPAGGTWNSPYGCNLGITSFHWIGTTATGKATIAAF